MPTSKPKKKTATKKPASKPARKKGGEAAISPTVTYLTLLFAALSFVFAYLAFDRYA